jgi:membrane fusion protein (multidrug efflux system)
MRVDFTIREQELPSLKIGQPVRAGLRIDELNFTGQIVGIDPKIDPDSRMVSVRAQIENVDGTLLPGQFVRIEVVLPVEKGVVVVPQTSVVNSLYGDYVYIVAKDPKAAPSPADPPPADGVAAQDQEAAPAENEHLIARQAFVKTGRRSGGIVEIVSGLTPGQQVISAGQNKLSNGIGVTVDNTGDLAGAQEADRAPGS